MTGIELTEENFIAILREELDARFRELGRHRLVLLGQLFVIASTPFEMYVCFKSNMEWVGARQGLRWGADGWE